MAHPGGRLVLPPSYFVAPGELVVIARVVDCSIILIPRYRQALLVNDGRRCNAPAAAKSTTLRPAAQSSVSRVKGAAPHLNPGERVQPPMIMLR